MKLALIFAEFGPQRPDVEHFRRYFPDADIQVHTEATCENIPQFDGPRYGWRQNDYWKVRKAYEADADVAIAWDSDMRIVSEDVRILPRLAENFGLCLPMNPRLMVRTDTMIGADSDGLLDWTLGSGLAVNCTPIALSLKHKGAMACVSFFLDEMENHPVRGPLAWWRAQLRSGFSPMILPPQWCVCQEHVGCGNEIALHVGHEKVRRHYKV